MKIVAFVHSVSSCWNNANAHFLRGTLRELALLGHEVLAYEPRDAWSRDNLEREHQSVEASGFALFYPEIHCVAYGEDLDLAEAIGAADLVLVHEWNPPELVAALGRERRNGRFTLMFWDTHHRAMSDPATMSLYDVSEYDAVLACGQPIAEIYQRNGWGRRAFVLHEAADHRLFKPADDASPHRNLVWIGNWERERTAELNEFLFGPAWAAGLPLDVYGVGYPPEALAVLSGNGVRYHGWLANTAAPGAFHHALAAVHVPRRLEATRGPGIPTIRVFEALACGTALLSAPWDDVDGLFTPNADFAMAKDGPEMTRLMRTIAEDPEWREALARQGRETILERHTCAHRAMQLQDIVADLSGRPRGRA